MKIIGCGISSKYLIFPFITPIFTFLRYYIGTFIQDYDDGINHFHKIKHHPIFFSFLTLIGDLLAGSLNIFSYFKNKPLREENEMIDMTDIDQLNNDLQTIKPFERITQTKSEESYLYSTGKVLLIILCQSILEIFMITSFFIIGCYSNPIFSFTMTITLMILESLISAPILKYKIHKHQVVSIVLIVLGFVLVSLPQIKIALNTSVIDKDPKNSWIYYPIYFSLSICFALLDVIQKWVMEKKFYTPYKLVLLQGSFSMCIFVIIFLFLPYFKCRWQFCNYDPSKDIMIEPFISTFKLLFSTNAGMRALMVITYELISAIYIMLLLVTIYYFTPTQRSVSDSLAAFINWIILVTDKSTGETFSIMPLIGYLIALVSCLIYNEIIIIYLCGLNDYTKREIDKRAKLDRICTLHITLDKIEIE